MGGPNAGKRRARTLCLAGLGLGVGLAGMGLTTLGGCGYSARDEYFAVRSLYVSASPGTGEVVAFGRPMSDQEAKRVVRLMNDSDTPIGGE
jgi:hypothetical protein